MTESFECVPPYTCFACPYDDCKREGDATQEEMSFRRTSRRRGSHDETYEWYVAHGICVRCRKKPALPGKVLCEDCKQQSCKRAARNYKSQDARRSQSDRVKAKIRKYRESGRCLICGRPIYGKHPLCMEHFLAARAYNHRRYEERMREKREGDAIFTKWFHGFGVEKCLYCDNPTQPGKKLCKKHYDIAVKNIQKAKRASMKKRKEARNAAKRLHGKGKGRK